MNNPNNIKRKIRHAKLLTKAGFKLDINGWMKQPFQGNKNSDVAKLIYWTNGETTLTFFDYQRLSLKSFLKKYKAQLKYDFKKKASVIFE